MERIMKQLTALKELAEKVEAGDYKTMGDTLSCAKAFGAYPHPDTQYAINAWNRGSLDAAHSLHKVVLGDRYSWWVEEQPDGDCVSGVFSKQRGRSITAVSTIPARAWLLAIIKAKIQEAENE